LSPIKDGPRHAKAAGKHFVVIRWGFAEVVRHHALHADIELAVHIRLPASDGPMRSRSVCLKGSADGEAHSGGGPSVLRGVHRDGIVVVERVEELPVLVCKHRMVHDVGGWQVQMLTIRPSRDALTL
jgi:hypothetical protein